MATLKAALDGDVAAVSAALDADLGLLDRPHVGGMFDSRTLLQCAASRGHAELVAMLVRRGAALGAVDKRGNTAESLAQKQGHAHVVSILRDPAQADAVAPTPAEVAHGRSPLAASAEGAAHAADSPGKRKRDGDDAAAERKRADTAAAAADTAAEVNEVTVELHVRGAGTHSYVAADGESITLHDLLAKLRKRHSLGPLTDVVDARGRPLESSSDVYSLWLEHSDSADGEGFETELHVHAVAGELGECESIFDILHEQQTSDDDDALS